MKKIMLILIFMLCVNVAYGATLHGAIYDPSYNLLRSVEVDINTTPKQSHIASDGVYFFYVPLGTYRLKFEKYYQKQLVYESIEVIEVSKDGEFQIDVIMKPVPGVEIPKEEARGPTLWTLLRARFGDIMYIAIGIMSAILIVGIIFFSIRLMKKKKIFSGGSSIINDLPSFGIKIEEPSETEHNGTSVATGKSDFNHDIEGVVDFIKNEGGRTTQKDIRKKIPLSEAKISLMISELESLGRVKKIKKGRGNIIVLQDGI